MFHVPFVRDQVTVPYASTLNIDWSQSDLQKVTLAGSPTITFSTVKHGQKLTLEIVQDGTGSRTITYSGATILWSGGAHTLSTAAAAIDVATYTCVSDGVFLAELKTAYA